MKIKNKKFGEFEIKLDNITQGAVEKFFKTLREDYPDNTSISGPEYLGDTVRVAMKLGWIEPAFVVDDTHPGQVRFIAGELQKLIAEALTIDPN